MVDEVINQVRSLPRVLRYKDKNEPDKTFIPWIVSFGRGYKEAQKKSEEVNNILAHSNTWKDMEPELKPKIKVVARRSPNLKDKLFKRRAIALDTMSSTGSTAPCTKPNVRRRGPSCQTCKLVSNKTEVKGRCVTVGCAGGDCKTNNVVYAASCKLCSRPSVYVGKTITPLNKRMNGHRSRYYDILSKAQEDHNFVPSYQDVDDESILGVHLFLEHGKRQRGDFNNSLTVDILQQCSPQNLRQSEQYFIDKLGTLYPFGLNQINSISGN